MTYSCRRPQCLVCQGIGIMPPLQGSGHGQLSGICPPAKPAAMSYKVAAFYQFAALADVRALREPLRARCADLRLKGSVLLAAFEAVKGRLRLAPPRRQPSPN